MKNLQIILDSILSKDIFEYFLINRNYQITGYSDGVHKYFHKAPVAGQDIRDHLPELVGYDKQVQDVFDTEKLYYILETIDKNGCYINLHVEHYSNEIALILLQNTTEITLSKLRLLQYSNENTLLYSALQKILDSQNTLLFVVHNNIIEYANRKFIDYFQARDIDEIKEKKLHLFKNFSSSMKSYDDLYKLAFQEEQKIQIGDDTFIIKATFLEAAYKLFTLSNITYLNNANLILEKEINIDSLTGLFRKNYFDEIVKKELQKKDPFTLVVIDIDNFKKINDLFGHVAGDNVLREFAGIIQNQLRHDDIFARWGGEEFLILIRCYSEENILEKMEKIRKLVSEHPFDAIGQITASFGIAVSHDNDDRESLLQRADRALYKAKQLGKNRVCLH